MSVHRALLPSLPLFALLLLVGSLHAQKVKIKGQVVHAEDPTFNLLIVNKTTAKGSFGNKDGSFEITADKNDTILVGALGYKTYKLTLADSALKNSYNVRIYLQRIQVELQTVRVFPKRELDSIQRDIRNLGYDERDYMLSGIDAMQSPLTFLYQQISRQERMKRRAYEIINEDRKRALLKELFSQYVDNDIIDLDESEFEDFVSFMNVSDALLRSMTQYEFVIYTKRRFQDFRSIPQRPLQDINTHD
jgi:hypothetical protein